MQERRNSIANALELRLSCTNASICALYFSTEGSGTRVEIVLIFGEGAPQNSSSAGAFMIKKRLEDSNFQLDLNGTMTGVAENVTAVISNNGTDVEGM